MPRYLGMLVRIRNDGLFYPLPQPTSFSEAAVRFVRELPQLFLLLFSCVGVSFGATLALCVRVRADNAVDCGADREVRSRAGKKCSDASPFLLDECTDMVKYVSEFYDTAIRYTTSTFLWIRPAYESQNRGVAPHISESREEARTAPAGG